MATDSEDIITRVNSRISAMRLFEVVLAHEPKSAPALESFTWALWVESWKPLASVSGLADTGSLLTLWGRIYCGFLREPQDRIDLDLAARVDAVIRDASDDLSLGLADEGVWTDLLGENSDGVHAITGYINVDNVIFRTADILIPVVMTSQWQQNRRTG